MTKIIIDTCVLYKLGEDETLFEQVKNKKLCPNWINLRELTTTGNLITKEEQTRAAIQKMFPFQDNAVFMPPPLYIVKDSQNVDFEITSNDHNISEMLLTTEKIAKGFGIDPTKKQEFLARNKEIKLKGLDGFADLLNIDIENFRKRYKKFIKKDTRKILKGKKKISRIINTLPSVYNFINTLVQASTNNKNSLEGIPLKDIELFAKTFNEFYKEKVISREKVERNDVYDMFILAYIKSEDKYWTFDQKWKDRITRAGCDRFLFEP